MKATKIILIAALAVGAMLACSSSVFAQDDTNSPPAGQRPPGGHGQNLERLAKALNLTGAQKDQLKPVLEAQMQQIKDLRADTSLSKEDRRAKMKSIHEDTLTKVKAILTADQFAKYQQLTQRRKAPPTGDAGTPPPQN